MWLNKFTDPLCKISGDKFVHLLTCQLIAFVIGKALSYVMNKYAAALIGCACAVAAGFVKEIKDDTFDLDDFKADVLGAVWGTVYLIT